MMYKEKFRQPFRFALLDIICGLRNFQIVIFKCFLVFLMIVLKDILKNF